MHVPNQSACSTKIYSLLLRFYEADITADHRVLLDEDELRSMGEPSGAYRFNEKALVKALPQLGTTSCRLQHNLVVLRAITLWGYMERHLGIESLSIRDDGTVLKSKRRVLSHQIFNYAPGPSIII